jgi:hypothetical protein
MSGISYHILYKGRKIYKNLSVDECMKVLEEFVESTDSNTIDLNEIELEEILNG